MAAPSPPLPLSKVIVAAGTYDGVLAGWELDGKNKKSNKFKILFASPEHEGSVRSLSIASRGGGGQHSANVQHAKKKKKMNHQNDGDDDEDDEKSSKNIATLFPGSLLSCGYDEILRTHDFSKHLTSSGEVRTPSDFGTPTCCAFAPPMILGASSSSSPSSTHCLLGFAGGKLVIYKKRDWNVQHVLNGHEGGIASIAVHPTGKMALTGGESDGKLKLWDLTKGRLSYSSKIRPKSLGSSRQGRKNIYEAIVCIVWSNPTSSSGDNDLQQSYAFCYGNHVTVRDVATGRDLLDVDLPSKVNQVCLIEGEEGLFLAAACDDGSLPVLAVSGGEEDDDDTSKERRAIMAIEPVDGPIAGEERFKCIQALTDYHVVAANSAGVISLMNLRGAINMICSSSSEDATDDNNNQATTATREGGSDEDEESKSDSDDNEEEELAVDIIDSVQLGSGARITSLVAWCQVGSAEDDDHEDSDGEDTQQNSVQDIVNNNNNKDQENGSNKRKFVANENDKAVAIDAQALERARSLVAKAKKIQKRKEDRKKGSNQKRVSR
jgi:WD domain, G-beta repeat